jgi:hypothetical protein
VESANCTSQIALCFPNVNQESIHPNPRANRPRRKAQGQERTARHRTCRPRSYQCAFRPPGSFSLARVDATPRPRSCSLTRENYDLERSLFLYRIFRRFRELSVSTAACAMPRSWVVLDARYSVAKSNWLLRPVSVPNEHQLLEG